MAHIQANTFVLTERKNLPLQKFYSHQSLSYKHFVKEMGLKFGGFVSCLKEFAIKENYSNEFFFNEYINVLSQGTFFEGYKFCVRIKSLYYFQGLTLSPWGATYTHDESVSKCYQVLYIYI